VVRWVGHAVCLREMRKVYTILVQKYEGKGGVNVRIILKFILQVEE
jgi:hypothetical protein